MATFQWLYLKLLMSLITNHFVCTQPLPCNPFTQSRHDTHDNGDRKELGWSDRGINFYNSICHEVITDRAQHGVIFHTTLWQTIDKCIEAQKGAKPDGAKKKKSVRVHAIPYSDLGDTPLPAHLQHQHKEQWSNTNKTMHYVCVTPTMSYVSPNGEATML